MTGSKQDSKPGSPIQSNLEKIDAYVLGPQDYTDIPEITDEDLDRADLYEGETLVRRGRPKLDRPKQQITLRLDQDVVEGFRSTGEGWQSRINAALRAALGRG